MDDARRRRGLRSAGRTPIATFTAVTTRDGNALERDGDEVYEVREVDAGGHSIMEVQFADGVWLLCEPGEIEPI